jgi:UDP-N-acetylglucosamine diphosphorylase / glucose-1-phosphate thymidylyltransferase / UDP-N-acetylgalactosamine diphosphorylase / glucosamine-1-phosphate N-acetyltransferase / galactosamine-1-phosphate N-acetyltransferase
MADVDLIVFDDAVARDWYPFTLTRPAGELLLGTLKLRERIERVSGTRCVGYIANPDLAGFDEGDTPPVIDIGQIDASRPRLYISSRCVLHWDVTLDLTAEATFRVADQVAGWLVPAGAAGPTEDDLLAPAVARGAGFTLGGNILENVWELIQDNTDHVASDILHFHPSAAGSARPANTHVIGEYPIVLGENVTIEPGVVFDVSAGPVWLDDGASVHCLTRIAGPMYVGRGSTLLGGVYNAGTIGPRCKIHGEFEESVILGYSNKAHEGFIGHAYIGCWVNFGALTTNSDLKNNYSNVRVWTPGGEVDTGLMKVGSLIGDHVKTAIGTMLNTGTVIGPGANVFGGMPPKHVAPFSWGDGSYELDKFLATAEVAMGRRDVALSASQREMLSRVYRENTR